MPGDIHRAFHTRTAQHGRSTEAEVREIVAATVKPERHAHQGEALTTIGRKIGLAIDDFAVESVRDKTPAESVSFE